MTAFLFWNVNRKPLQTVIADLVFRYDVDVLILAENEIPVHVLLEALNQRRVEYHYTPGLCKKIHIYTRFSSRFLRLVSEDHRLTVRHLALPGLTDILLAACHFPSKRDWSDESQAQECTVLAGTIKLAEQSVGHSRTLL